LFSTELLARFKLSGFNHNDISVFSMTHSLKYFFFKFELLLHMFSLFLAKWFGSPCLFFLGKPIGEMHLFLCCSSLTQKLSRTQVCYVLLVMLWPTRDLP